jgi:eukaryotic-like serine/threonine-protein kinase
MEFIEGETLSSRLQKGPLTTGDLLRYSIQIADALNKAHKQGIIHRDLKPGNIMLTKSGVKLLDFGLAKVAERKETLPGVSQLATEQREITKAGTILGTFQYIAPEQLEGKDVDARTDIFAFGAVLYEMATGKKAFDGNSQANLIAAILKEDPKPISQIQPLTPPILERLVKTCLMKDPDDRWQSAHDIGNELRWISETSGLLTTTITQVQNSKNVFSSKLLGWMIAGALALLLIFGSFLTWTRSRNNPAVTSEIRFWIPSTPGMNLGGTLSGNPDFAISHDGTKLIYVVFDPTGKNQLWYRSLASFNSQPIPGTENGEFPCWSPDDQQIAFFAGKKLKRILVSGGSPSLICDDVENNVLGTTWLADGTIVFGTVGSGLSRVSADGGKPDALTSLNRDRQEVTHSYPIFIPDGRHFLYTADSNKAEERAVYLGSLDSKDVIRLLNVRHKVNYIEPGYLLFVRGVSLMAQRFQLSPPRLTGEVFPVAEDLSVNSAVNSAPFTASLNGTILYRGGDTLSKTQLAWFDRHGKPLGKVGTIQSDISVRLSPDGTRAVVSSAAGPGYRSATGEASVNIWVLDLGRSVRTRVTFDPAISDENPTWSPDGRFLAFASHRNNDRAEIYEKAFSGEGQDKPLLPGGTINPHPIDLSQDGKTLLLHGNGNQLDLFTLSLSEKDAKPVPFVTSLSNDGQGQFSPDGRWFAYTSAESGSNEVYVKPFPSGDGKWQISSTGGSEPRWRGDGKELFYLTADGTLMSVSVKAESVFEAAPAVALFKTGTIPIDIGSWGGAGQYDVTKDGSRFLINTIVVPATPPNLYVIVNWKPPDSK